MSLQKLARVLNPGQLVEVDAEFEAGRADAKAGRAPVIDLEQLHEDLGSIAYHAGYDTGLDERAFDPAAHGCARRCPVTAMLARLPRLDPPQYFPARGEDRCGHDMLIFHSRSTCSICLGLPDVPDLEAVFVAEFAPSPSRWIVLVETHSDCVRCYTPLPLGRRAIYSAREAGVVGPCCEAVA